jgi:G3E family GTPase
MGNSTSVFLITGFLGSGKTTFLNRIIAGFPKDLKLTILMNEFGEIGIDGTLVEGDDIDMLEISRGSIFCVCVKADFIKGLYELSARLKPDVLIIESTGVANPSDLRRDLQLAVFQGRFQFAEQFCIIDAAHFLEAFAVFASVEKQLSSSTVFIINKTDLVDARTVASIKDLIREHHPEPLFFETSYADIDLASLSSLPVAKKDSVPEAAVATPVEPCSEQELEAFITTLLADPELQSFPPDNLASVTYRWHGEDLNEIAAMAEKLPSAIVRAKGFVQTREQVYLFSYVMGVWTVELSVAAHDTAILNMLVFIGRPEDIGALHSLLVPPQWSAREVLLPFSGIVKM